jgi:hypothetical protein
MTVAALLLWLAALATASPVGSKQAVVETSAGTFIIDLAPEGGAEPGRPFHEARR